MGKQSCLVLCAVIFLFFAMLASIVALATPSWVSVSVTINNQTNYTLFGLWASCIDGVNCQMIDSSVKPRKCYLEDWW